MKAAISAFHDRGAVVHHVDVVGREQRPGEERRAVRRPMRRTPSASRSTDSTPATSRDQPRLAQADAERRERRVLERR